jgi:hypothetical protein
MLAAVVSEPIAKAQVQNELVRAGAPAALGHFVRHGLGKEPVER